MKLYIMPGACSLADHILLRWSGSSFDLQFLDHQSMKAPEYLALNPSGAVPALQVGDWVLTQNAAILNYITDIAPAERGLSGDGSLKARAEINRWIAFSNSDVHPMYWALFGGTAYLQDPQMIARSQDNARQKLRVLYQRADAHLKHHNWLANGQRSGADAYLYVTLRWAKKVGVDLSSLDALSAFFERMEADPGVQAALQAEGLI
ncbi:glutathione S-transferase C-terminal domain-containing protein [Xylella fastidiosa]|uniref:Glutathione S-transferase n=2 Tax=Xylella fastidiosa (strain 9a5c) TaxID=160492 RepID=Q9PE18_XYLFA|nr:glutathione binding-like protein [Xylella fastidiosa]AAF84020.1 glutathione S-transferase [Xylella fastidiosa 9a5c]ALQ94648.1 glutathione S-transferase [Xylella fastidiosa]ALQ97425.1 glutathione S-transferase C-terminal domain-containing protein [Xylella fastidiosa]ALR04640.1 glutathione S-transferase C-terminal domain-containing protein [Xylella fastidiosa]ALR09205.2 glutathione S-transferase [Xylella fastidiosa]